MRAFLNRCLLTSMTMVSFIFLSALFLVPGSQVNAASIYDNAYQTTDKLILNSGLPGYDDEDFTYLYQRIINGDSGYEAQWSRGSNANLSEEQIESERERWSNRHNWTISQFDESIFPGESRKFINIIYSTESDMSLIWSENDVQVSTGNNDRYGLCITTEPIGGKDFRVIVSRVGESGIACNNSYISTSDKYITNYVAFVANENYPPDYEGLPVRDSIDPPSEPAILYPQYSWTLESDGQLKIAYMKNLEYFLTGSTSIGTYHMTENWGALDGLIDGYSYTPSGWLDYDSRFPIPNTPDDRLMYLPDDDCSPSTPCYFQIAIGHNQQLDNPPWPENADELYFIDTRYIQIVWDGQKRLTGNTNDCADGTICNPFEQERNKIFGYFSDLAIPTYGLQTIILAPLAFIAQLPSQVCSPLVLPLPNMGNLTLPCMTTDVYSVHFLPLLNLYQTVLVGLFAYYVSLRLFGSIKEMTNPRDDSIDTVRL